MRTPASGWWRRGGHPYIGHPKSLFSPHLCCRARLSSDSDPEDAPATSREGGPGLFPLPVPKGGSRVSSEESEEEGGEEPPRPPTRPPRPQAVSEGTLGWAGDPGAGWGPPTPPSPHLAAGRGQCEGGRFGGVVLSSVSLPQFCTFGSRLVSPGCYVFNRRLDRFCSALGSMLERHLSSHMWR